LGVPVPPSVAASLARLDGGAARAPSPGRAWPRAPRRSTLRSWRNGVRPRAIFLDKDDALLADASLELDARRVRLAPGAPEGLAAGTRRGTARRRPLRGSASHLVGRGRPVDLNAGH